MQRLNRRRASSADLWGVALVLGALATALSPLLGVALIAVLMALIWPVFTMTALVSWVLLCRPGAELLSFTFGGVAFTEVDGAILLALVASLRVKGRSSEPGWVGLLLAWPIWMIVRSLFGAYGQIIEISPLVDLRVLEAVALMPAFSALITARGSEWVLRWFQNLGLVVCVVALAARISWELGVLPTGETSLVNITLNPLVVRPGGEILLCVLAAAVAFDVSRGTRWRTGGAALLSIEVLCSQTLSIVLAIAVGIAAVALVVLRDLRLPTRLALFLGGVAVLALASGAVAPDSRFNLEQRGSEDSAQYRVTEFRDVARTLDSPPAVLLGAGPGTMIQFQGEAISEIKRDTHNPLLTVVLKGGALGLLLWLVPIIRFVRRLIQTQHDRRAVMLASVASILVLSLSVPFLLTVGGYALLIGLFYVARDLSETHG